MSSPFDLRQEVGNKKNELYPRIEMTFVFFYQFVQIQMTHIS